MRRLTGGTAARGLCSKGKGHDIAAVASGLENPILGEAQATASLIALIGRARTDLLFGLAGKVIG